MRTGVSRGDLRERAVECGVEDGNLRPLLSEDLPRYANASKIVRIMQRRERAETLDGNFDSRVDAHCGIELRPPAHYAMSCRLDLIRSMHQFRRAFPQHAQQILRPLRDRSAFFHHTSLHVLSASRHFHDQLSFRLIRRRRIELRLPDRLQRLAWQSAIRQLKQRTSLAARAGVEGEKLHKVQRASCAKGDPRKIRRSR